MPVKCIDELKARTVELVLHAQPNLETANGATIRVANALGLGKETLRAWVRDHKDSRKAMPAESVDDLEGENCRLQAELAEEKRANEILKRASVCSRQTSTDHSSDRRFHRRQPSRARHHTYCACMPCQSLLRGLLRACVRRSMTATGNSGNV